MQINGLCCGSVAGGMKYARRGVDKATGSVQGDEVRFCIGL